MSVIATISLCLIQACLWIIGAIVESTGANSALAMSAANVILRHIRPWVYLTSGFYQSSILQLIPSLVLTYVLGKKAEQHLGTVGLFRLIGFVNLLAGVFIFVDIFILYTLFRNPLIFGFTGGICAMLVALVHENPAATVGMPIRHLPFLVCTSLILITLGAYSIENDFVFELTLSSVPYSLFGFKLGWFYLRFLHKYADGTVGDTSEAFAYAVFFPDSCRPVISPISTFFFGVVLLCGCFKNRAGSALPTKLPLSTSRDAVSERRRARAKKALDSKLAKLANLPPASQAKEADNTINDAQSMSVES